VINRYNKTMPTIVEIPSKDNPYDPDKDRVMNRVKQLLGKD
jgi:V-type H+-transporting ATPase subunit F